MATQYDAFISYRHTPLDSRIAKEVQTRLERAVIPAAIRKQTGKKRINRVFRDKEELPITSDINDDITLALQNSQFLIVICSENTSASIWVQREIDEFLTTHDISKVLTVLAGGEPQDVIPETLRFREELVDGVLTRKEIEPLSCDFRGRSRKLRQQEFPRLLAVILGCSYDDLRQRQRRRKLQQLFSGLLAGLLLVSGIAIYALDRAHRIAEQAETIALQKEQIEEEAETIALQKDQLQEQYNNTLITQSRYLSEVSEALLQTGDRKTAIQVALAALPDGSQDTSRPVTTEALYALNNALYSYRQARFNSFVPEATDELLSSHRYNQMSPDGTCWVVTDWDDNLHFYDMETSRLFFTLTAEEISAFSPEILKTVTFLSDDRIALCFDSSVVCLDYRNNQLLWTGNIQEVTSPDSTLWWCDLATTYNEASDTLFLVAENANTFYACGIDCSDGTVSLRGQQTVEAGYISEFLVEVSDDGKCLAVGYSDTASDEGTSAVLLFDLSSHRTAIAAGEHSDMISLTWLDSDRLLVLSSDYDPYGENLCSYSVQCYQFSTETPLWVMTDQQYIADSSTTYYWDASGQLLSASLALAEDGSMTDVILLRFGDRVAVLHPEDGRIITYAEFQASPLTMDIGGKDRLFLTLRDGSIVQYIVDVDLTAQMGSIDSMIAGAAFSSKFEKYAMVKANNTSIVFIGNQIYDDGGITLTYDENIASAYYLSDDIAEYRVVCTRAELGGGKMHYSIYFYNVGETEPIAQAEYTGSYLLDMTVGHQNGDPTVYWIYETTEGTTRLCGWDLLKNEQLCDYEIHSETLLSTTMDCLPDGTLAIRFSQGVIFTDPIAQSVRHIATRGYCYAISISPDYDTVLMFDEDYENDYTKTLRCISYPSLEEHDLPAELVSSISGACVYHTEFVYSPKGDYMAYACGDYFNVVDTGDYSIVATIPVPCKNTSAAAFLTETTVALFGDSGHVQTWDIPTGTMIMEDRFTHASCSIRTKDSFMFTQETVGLSSSVSHQYRVNEDGTFAREFSVEDGILAYGGNEVITLFNDTAMIYPTYTLDQLIEKATTVIDGELLTDADRIKYYING